MSAAMQNSTMRTSHATAPFRAPTKPARSNRRNLAVRATQEPAELAKKAGAAFAAAALAITPLSASALETGLQHSVGSAEQLQGKAADAAKDAAGTLKKNLNPKNADPAIAGNALREAGKNANPKNVAAPALSDSGLQVNVGAAEQLQDKAKSAAKDAANTVKKNADPRNADASIAGNALREAGKNANPKNVAFQPASGLQLNVGTAEQLQGKAQSAAKDAASTLKKNADPRNADASIAGNALREAGKNANPKNVAFSPDNSSLQWNVGSAEQLQGKAQSAAKDAANTLKKNADPRNADASIAGNALREAGKNANPKNVAFQPASDLQVNVSSAEQLQGKAQSAAKDAANTLKKNADPRNADASIAGNALREAGKNANPKNVAFQPASGLQVNVGTAEQLQDKAKSAAKDAANTFKKNADPRNADASIAGNALREAGKNANPKNVAFQPASGLQINVGTAEQLQDKAKSAAKDAASTLKKNADPRNADASIAGNALREAGKNANPKNL